MYKRILSAMTVFILVALVLEPISKPFASTAPPLPPPQAEWIKKQKDKIEKEVKDRINPNKAAEKGIAKTLRSCMRSTKISVL